MRAWECGKPRTNMKRFWERVDMTGDCWNWTGFRADSRYGQDNGYGLIRFCGHKQLAHRLAYLFTFGTIPIGMHVLHKCDNPACCNPAHLWLGTADDNMKDASKKGRISKVSRNAGEKCAAHKLTEDYVKVIKARNFLGETQLELALGYGVNPSTISYAISGRTWGGC